MSMLDGAQSGPKVAQVPPTPAPFILELLGTFEHTSSHKSRVRTKLLFRNPLDSNEMPSALLAPDFREILDPEGKL